MKASGQPHARGDLLPGMNIRNPLHRGAGPDDMEKEKFLILPVA
jgi:hypothetical protein